MSNKINSNILEKKFMNDTILNLLDDSNYLVVGFSHEELIYKNKRFDHYFHEISNKEDFKSRIIEHTVEEGIDKYFLNSPDGNGGMIKFECTSYRSKVLYIGVKLDYEKVASFLRHIECVTKIPEGNFTKIIDFKKNKTKSYCTLVLDDSWIIKYYSDNVYSLFGIENPQLKSIKEVFGQELYDALKEKYNYIDIFNDLAIEYQEMLIVMSKSEYGFIILNFYPYSCKAFNKFDEIGELTYKVEQLEKELDRRKKLIDMQKTIIRNISR